ncbi:hypothetical protein SNEBB_002244 [Seison nebaliae]|nr:hypothetical protein SNEBB_002244 [Seison nebaliae]
MLIFKDIFTGDDVLSDSYKMKLVDNCYYEVDGGMMTVDSGISDALIGGNASAEGDDVDDTMDTAEKVINIVHNHKLQLVPYSKKDYKAWVMKYMKKLKAKVAEKEPGRTEEFMKAAQNLITKKILPDFDNFDTYISESLDDDGMIVVMNYREDGTTPYFIYFKDGLEEEKF